MLEVVLLAFLATGCMCFEKYIPAYGDEFVNLPFKERFPTYKIISGDWVQHFALMKAPVYVRCPRDDSLLHDERYLMDRVEKGGIPFGFYSVYTLEKCVKFLINEEHTAHLSNIQFEFQDKNQCRLHLEFESDNAWTWKVTSKVYTEPDKEFEDDAIQKAVYAISPDTKEIDFFRKCIKTNTPTWEVRDACSSSFSIEWIENILKKSPKLPSNGKWNSYDGVPVIFKDSVLQNLYTFHEVMCPRIIYSDDDSSTY